MSDKNIYQRRSQQQLQQTPSTPTSTFKNSNSSCSNTPNSTFYDVESNGANDNHPIDSDKNTKATVNRTSSTFIILLLVILWYSAAVFSITSSKMIMLSRRLPFFLSTMQFTTATLITWIVLRFRKTAVPISFAGPGASAGLQQPAQARSMFRNLIVPTAVSYTFGFIFTNVAFSLAPPSFAETVKAGEPLTSVFLSYLFLSEQVSWLTYSTLLPICAGVGISCIDKATFQLGCFLFAAASNVCFSGRAVISKKMFSTFPGAIDELLLFAYISRIGLVILLPCAWYMEWDLIWALKIEPTQWLGEYFLLLVLNGVAYTAYNLLSFMVLSRTDLVTHAVLNVFRRVAIISFTTWFFSTRLSGLNVVGVVVAVIGVLLFALSKNRDGRSQKE